MRLINANDFHKVLTPKEVKHTVSRLSHNPHIKVYPKQVVTDSQCRWGKCKSTRVLNHFDLNQCLEYYRYRLGDGTGRDGYKHLIKSTKKYIDLFEKIQGAINEKEK